ncbi:MAG: (4Fe-4S)-binding protein [Ignavibacteria bacterium]|nr:(4Fe-4S)-binding protein [Ignavibacteria bacterium]
MSKFDKTYTNGEVTVFWKPDLCIHSTKCFHSLPEVFNPKIRPWVQLDKSSSDKIIETVKNCPSGALSFKYNGESSNEGQNLEEPKTEPISNSSVRIEVTNNGPFMVTGSAVIINKDGTETIKEGKFALCRCGQSTRKPFCDGTHKSITFDS